MKKILLDLAQLIIVVIGITAIQLSGAIAVKEKIYFLLTWQWWICAIIGMVIVIPAINFWKKQLKNKSNESN